MQKRELKKPKKIIKKDKVPIKKDIETIKQEIKDAIDHDSKLHSYLYDLVYHEVTDDIDFLEKIYCGFLEDDRSSMRTIAIYALLFMLQIKRDRYKALALEWIQNTDNSSDMRMFTISGLRQAYAGTKDPQLLSFFFKLFNDENEDEDLRGDGFYSMMRVFGLSSLEIRERYKISLAFKHIEVKNFEQEMEAIREICQIKY